MKVQGIWHNLARQRTVPAILLCLLSASCGGPSKPLGVVGHVSGFGGMVVADEPRAALVGRDVLSAGGSPADAAVAMAFSMAVTLPSQVSLGAGGVCMVYDRGKKKTEVLDFTAPPAAQPATENSRPNALPALPRGMYALYAKYGKLKWEPLLAPAETMARLGIPVSRALAQQLAPQIGRLSEDPEARRIFVGADGKPLGEGDKLVQADLGATLSRLRSRGVGEFYTGAAAADLAGGMQQAGGQVTALQLQAFVPQWKEPVAVPYGDDVALFPPPPAAAGLFEAELWAALARDGAYHGAGAADRPHLLAETEARIFADRQRWMNSDGSATETSTTLLGKAHLQQLLAGSGGAHVAQQGRAPADQVAGTGFAAIDGDGSAVVCTISLNAPFGTGRMMPGSGMLLAAANGERGEGPYDLGPMLGVNLNSNEFRFAGAAGGGTAAPTALVEVGLAALIDGLPLEQAVAAKRLHAVNAPDRVLAERGYPGLAGLTGRGHQVEEVDLPGRVNAIACGSGDPRVSRCAVATDPRAYGLAITVGND